MVLASRRRGELEIGLLTPAEDELGLISECPCIDCPVLLLSNDVDQWPKMVIQLNILVIDPLDVVVALLDVLPDSCQNLSQGIKPLV